MSRIELPPFDVCFLMVTASSESVNTTFLLKNFVQEIVQNYIGPKTKTIEYLEQNGQGLQKIIVYHRIGNHSYKSNTSLLTLIQISGG
jgi:hypothetical protein